MKKDNGIRLSCTVRGGAVNFSLSLSIKILGVIGSLASIISLVTFLLSR